MDSTVTSTEAKNKLNRILSEIERTGQSVTITNRGCLVARLIPAQPLPRAFGQLPNLFIPSTFDGPLPGAELAAWEGGEES